MQRALFVVTIAGALAACGGSGASSADASRPRPTASRSMNVVTAEEIQRQGGSSLLDVLRNLRPLWFRENPTTIRGRAIYADAVIVYIDGQRVGGLVSLNEIPVRSVIQVRYYSASEAQGRFGLDNLQGAIDVTTTR